MEKKNPERIIIPILIAVLAVLCIVGGTYYIKVYKPAIKQATEESTLVAQKTAHLKKRASARCWLRLTKATLRFIRTATTLSFLRTGRKQNIPTGQAIFQPKPPLFIMRI